ncbi:hypothetical protein AB0C81_33195 [Streptomyces roseoverticillatus]|uniref:hypothetical protein n=1 Tax=Streptomyces roseoverticillatus TaxID=66429 RepID=UPI0033F5C2A2
MIVWTVLLLLTLLLFGSRLLRALLWIDAAVALIVWILGFGRRTRSRGRLRYGCVRRSPPSGFSPPTASGACTSPWARKR